MDIVAYDFDGSLTMQQPLLQAYGIPLSVQSMRQFERSVRLWASLPVFKKMAQSLRRPSAAGQFSLIGSGDYHHVSLALISQFTQPLTVVLFDNHPDWMRPPHQFHCGTWVYSLARLEHVERIVIIGLESGDIAEDQFEKGDMESYLQRKVVLLPYQPVQVGALTLKSGFEQHVFMGIAELLAEIETDNIYISVDKDCLRAADARTNWEQGSMPLSTVTAAIRALKAHKHVVGADTVGDFSPVRFRSPLKWIASYLDRREHPREEMVIASRINAAANVQLIQALTGKTS
jgi:arginase family enzyme